MNKKQYMKFIDLYIAEIFNNTKEHDQIVESKTNYHATAKSWSAAKLVG